MQYINTKTGAVIDSPCTIYGGDWEALGGNEHEQWAVTEEADGVHVRPVVDGEIVDTPIESRTSFSKAPRKKKEA